MASHSRRRPPARQTPEPTVSAKLGAKLLRERIEKADELLATERLEEHEDDFINWETVTGACLEKAFGKGSPHIKQVMLAGRMSFSAYDAVTHGGTSGKIREWLKSMSKRLLGAIEILELEAKHQGKQPGDSVAPPIVEGNRIFVVHGHNEAIKQAVCRLLEQLNLEPVVLHEQPDKGRTIIEKFTDHADVAFAVVLLTADDLGHSKADKEPKPRARQNVILELGYFVALLGRDRVCALQEKGVEVPSDFAGVLYKPLDEHGAWRLALAEELRAAGLDVDLNHLSK